MKILMRQIELYSEQILNEPYDEFLKEIAERKAEAEAQGFSNFSVSLESTGHYAEEGAMIVLRGTKEESDESFAARVEAQRAASDKAKARWAAKRDVK